jgi:hypothetical protein
LTTNLGRLSEATNRVRSVADRFFGPTPAPAGGIGGEKPIGTTKGELDARLAALDVLVSDLAEQVCRVERIA